MDIDRDQHEPNIEPEIESSEMYDHGGADFGFMLVTVNIHVVGNVMDGAKMICVV